LILNKENYRKYVSNIMTYGPFRESQSFRVAISIIQRAGGRRPLTTKLVGNDVNLNSRRVAEIIGKIFSDELGTSGGVICFTAGDGGGEFLLKVERLEDKIIARERKR
jgi:hypothetical protein